MAMLRSVLDMFLKLDVVRQNSYQALAVVVEVVCANDMPPAVQAEPRRIIFETQKGTFSLGAGEVEHHVLE